jgi:hypothetical protein
MTPIDPAFLLIPILQTIKPVGREPEPLLLRTTLTTYRRTTVLLGFSSPWMIYSTRPLRRSFALLMAGPLTMPFLLSVRKTYCP